MGEKFDPNMHEAMFEAPGTGQESGTIIEVIAKRIQELREDGVPITSHWKKHPVSGQRYTRYVLGNLAA